MHLVIGLGETGRPLYQLLKETVVSVAGYDMLDGGAPDLLGVDFMHICIPYCPSFVQSVRGYQNRYKPRHTIIHSTVPIGTTSMLEGAVHSPILGMHDNMLSSLKSFPKWIGGTDMHLSVMREFQGIFAEVIPLPRPEHTEALKLMCLAKYGVSLAFAAYQRDICEQLNIPWSQVCAWDDEYNEYVGEDYKRPVFRELNMPIGGHCVIPGTERLNEQYPHPLLDEVLKCSPEALMDKDIVDYAPLVYEPANVYDSAKFGTNCKVGAFTEIGDNVKIGNSVTIGAFCFIPEGVTIEDDVWIGPRVTFSNDMYPPSGRVNWEKTKVKQGARIGAAVSIRPGVTIGHGALIGMGAVVTEDVPDYEIWAGVPAKQIVDGRLNGEVVRV